MSQGRPPAPAGAAHHGRAPAPASRPAMRGLAAVVPALVALALHLPSVRFGFVRDDLPLIAENAMMRSPGTLGRLLGGDFLASAGFTGGLWRPLVLLSFWLEGRLAGWGPTLFHATNVVLHAGVTLVVGLLLLQAGLGPIATLVAALWFAVMPAHLEVVAWILGRTDLLCSGLALLSLWLDRRARLRGRAWPGVGALAAFAGALLSKEAAAGWIAVVAAAELVGTRRTAAPPRVANDAPVAAAPEASPPTALPRWDRARWLAPYLAVTVLWLAAHALAAGRTGLPPWVDAALLARRHAAAALMLPQWLAFLWPWYPHASDVAAWLPPKALAWPVLAGSTLTLAGGAALAVLARRRSAWLVPAALLGAAVLPSLALALGPGFVTSGERMVYLPSAGIVWFAALAWDRAWAGGAIGRGLAILVAAILILGSAVETVRLAPSWADDEHVFRTKTERAPDDPTGWVGLADALARADRRNEALVALGRAAALAPRLPSVPLEAAQIHYQYGAWDAVIAAAGQALALDPSSFEARILRASALLRVGREAEAARDIARLLHDRPDHPSALMLEGQRLMAEGHPAEAVVPLTHATRAAAGNPSLWFALGSAQAAAGDLGSARASFERGLGLEPGSAPAWRMLARLCAALGDRTAADAAMQHARAASGAGPGAPGNAGAPLGTDSAGAARGGPR